MRINYTSKEYCAFTGEIQRVEKVIVDTQDGIDIIEVRVFDIVQKNVPVLQITAPKESNVLMVYDYILRGLKEYVDVLNIDIDYSYERSEDGTVIALEEIPF